MSILYKNYSVAFSALLVSSLLNYSTINAAKSLFDPIAKDDQNIGYAYAYDLESSYLFKRDFTLTQFKDGTKQQLLGAEDLKLDSDCSDGITSMAIYKEELYVGGCFKAIKNLPNTSNLAKWDGVNWNAVPGKVDRRISTILGTESGLYIGGHFTSVAGVSGTQCLAVWDGSKWKSVGGGVKSGNFVKTISKLGDTVVVGGVFSSVGNGVAAQSLATWDGFSWEGYDLLPLGRFAFVNSVAPGSAKYIGGMFFTESELAQETIVAAFRNKDQWEPLGIQPVPKDSTNSRGFAIHYENDSDIYLGGYNLAVKDQIGLGAVRWDGDYWSPFLLGRVTSITSAGQKIVFTGRITENLDCEKSDKPCQFFQLMEYTPSLNTWKKLEE